jgi:hypothetical protein
MKSEDLKEVIEAIVPSDLILQWCDEIGVIERERRLNICELVRCMILACSSPSGAAQADVLRAYLHAGAPHVSTTAFYNWFTPRFEQLMDRLAAHTLAYSRAQVPDLPVMMQVASDWIIVDATTCRLPDAFLDVYPSTGDYAALKVHKHLSIGTGCAVHYHFSPAVEHDSPHLTIDASWAGKGLLCDLAYASIKRLRACQKHGVSFVIRLKDNWKPRVQEVRGKDLREKLLEGADFDALIELGVLPLEGELVDAIVLVGNEKRPLRLRLVGVDTHKGYCFFLTNLPETISAWEVSEIYRTRWEVETSFKLDKSEQGLDEAASPASVNPHAVRALMHASLISSTLTTLLVHKHNSSVKKNAAGERIEAPLHPRRLAMQLVVSSASIIAAMEMEGAAAQKLWRHVAEVLTISGADPNWRRRPSVLDRLRGWPAKTPAAPHPPPS